MGTEKPNIETTAPPAPLAYAAPDRSLKNWPVVLAWVGICFSLPTICYGVFAVAGTIHELSTSGEGWGSVGIFFGNLAAMLWQIAVTVYLLLGPAHAESSRMSPKLRRLVYLVIILAFGSIFAVPVIWFFALEFS